MSTSDSTDNGIREGEPPLRAKFSTPAPSKRSISKRFLVVVCVVLILPVCAVCILPGEVCRLRYGRPLLTFNEWQEFYRRIKPGMTFVEVQKNVGDPHEIKRSPNGASIRWVYYVRSSLSPVIDGFVIIEYDRDGRVENMYEDR
jgi:hypothetical protein